MRRWAFHILCGCSLLAFLATVALWARSHFEGDWIGFRYASTNFPSQKNGTAIISGYSTYRMFAVISDRGTIGFVLGPGGGPPLPSTESDLMWKEYRRSSPPPSLGYMSTPRSKSLVLPYAAVALLAAVLPSWWMIRRFRNRSRKPRGFEVASPLPAVATHNEV
jgi:hypothetical protein